MCVLCLDIARLYGGVAMLTNSGSINIIPFTSDITETDSLFYAFLGLQK